MTELIKRQRDLPRQWLHSHPFDLLWRNLFDTDSIFDTVFNSKIDYPLDIYETDTDLIIEIAAVGVNKEDIQIKTYNNQLSISYDNTNECKDNRYCIKRGIARRSFKFEWKVNSIYDLDKITVSLDKGLLNLTIPRVIKEETKQEKIIEIN